LRLFIFLFSASLLTAQTAQAWVLELAPHVTLDRPVVRLADVLAAEAPTTAGALVLRTGGKPGEVVEISRAAILRRLVSERLAGDVVCRGPESCRITFAGRQIAVAELEKCLLAELGNWLPSDPDRAPAGWVEVNSELPGATMDGDWRLELVEPARLDPGRNLVRCRIVGGGRVIRFTATVTCHIYGEVARVLTNVNEDDPLAEGLFVWEWRDLTQVAPGRVVGRGAVAGMSARGHLAAGEPLRLADIHSEPLVRQGETVELCLDRGGVAVTLRGTAREDGVQGAMVYVRNELDGRLIRARVTGQGRVSWSR